MVLINNQTRTSFEKYFFACSNRICSLIDPVAFHKPNVYKFSPSRELRWDVRDNRALTFFLSLASQKLNLSCDRMNTYSSFEFRLPVRCHMLTIFLVLIIILVRTLFGCFPHEV